ncbi:hypothetical protein [Poriferisphaera sp. WC338]|uniref:hypothetical protein n=1 Tax=Poriferisphaera sp. WC338 TaxID=3425129 RepID=UPI003D814E5E
MTQYDRFNIPGFCKLYERDEAELVLEFENEIGPDGQPKYKNPDAMCIGVVMAFVAEFTYEYVWFYCDINMFNTSLPEDLLTAIKDNYHKYSHHKDCFAVLAKVLEKNEMDLKKNEM